MTFLSSNKYKEVSLQTKASACITSDNLSKFLPEKCIKIKVKNIHFAVTQVSRMFYPDSDIDYPDMNVVESKKIKNLKAILNVTTDKCYENQEKGLPFKEDDKLGGLDIYSASKACSEILTKAYYKSFFEKKINILN